MVALFLFLLFFGVDKHCLYERTHARAQGERERERARERKREQLRGESATHTEKQRGRVGDARALVFPQTRKCHCSSRPPWPAAPPPAAAGRWPWWRRPRLPPRRTRRSPRPLAAAYGTGCRHRSICPLARPGGRTSQLVQPCACRQMRPWPRRWRLSGTTIGPTGTLVSR